MTEWTSISVTEEQKAALEAAQEQAGHDGAIGRFLAREVAGDGREGLTTTVEVDADDVADTVVEKIEQSDYEDFDDWFSPDVARTIAQHVVEDMGIDETRKAAKQAEANTEEIKRQLEAIQGAMV